MTNLAGAILDPLLRDDPAGPRITYYDDATGERIELSTVTLANWAAKTANLLRDEYGAGPGSAVAVLLPARALVALEDSRAAVAVAAVGLAMASLLALEELQVQGKSSSSKIHENIPPHCIRRPPVRDHLRRVLDATGHAFDT